MYSGLHGREDGDHLSRRHHDVPHLLSNKPPNTAARTSPRSGWIDDRLLALLNEHLDLVAVWDSDSLSGSGTRRAHRRSPERSMNTTRAGDCAEKRSSGRAEEEQDLSGAGCRIDRRHQRAQHMCR